ASKKAPPVAAATGEMLAKTGIETWRQAMNCWLSSLPWWLAVLLASSTQPVACTCMRVAHGSEAILPRSIARGSSLQL
ncbi:hypothetical protein IN49_23365, partial [Salmonella enterica]